MFLGSIDKRSDGACRNLQNITDLFVTFSFYKRENDDSSIFLWKRLDNGLYSLVRFVRMKISDDIIVTSDFLYQCLAFLIFYIETQVIFFIFLPEMID